MVRHLGLFVVMTVCMAGTVSAQVLSGPAWQTTGNQEDAQFGFSVSTAGDVNGDGYDDVIVGQPLYWGNYFAQGRAYLYNGSPSGLEASPSWVSEGPIGGLERFGFSVSTAGDVNGDGYADVIVGAPAFEGAGPGWVYVFHGSATGLSTTPDWGAVGDPWSFGYSVSTAGDVNGDGYDDVIIGWPQYTNGGNAEGRAQVYCGSAQGLHTAEPDGPAWTAEGQQAEGQFGFSVSTAGDVNGDGYDDVIVGQPHYNDNSAKIYVYHGSATGLNTFAAWEGDYVIGSENCGPHGVSVSTAGDVNGDGYDDVIFATMIASSCQLAGYGFAYLYHGSSQGLNDSYDWRTFIQKCVGNECSIGTNWDRELGPFGLTVSTAGDVNDDGFDDIVIGFPVGYQDETARVYGGSPSGLPCCPEPSDPYIYPPIWLGNDGDRVSTAGDVNGDGVADVILGYPDSDTKTGKATVYLGSLSGCLSDGDCDGDGIADAIDLAPSEYSADFSDVSLGGTTTGTISDRGDQILSLTEEKNRKGVRVEALPEGGPAHAVIILSCSAEIHQVSAGDNFVLACAQANSSNTLATESSESFVLDAAKTLVFVEEGAVTVEFTALDGRLAVADLSAGNTLLFDPFSFIVEAPAENTSEVVVVIDGETVQLAPGSSAQGVSVTIKPGEDALPTINCANPRAMIPVAILTTSSFDASTVDHNSVTLGPGKAHEVHDKQPRHEEDVDSDGDLDLVLHFYVNEAALTCADSVAAISGMTYDGVQLTARGSVRMVDEHLRLEAQTARPPTTALHTTVPNPFNPVTAIRFDLAIPGHVRLEVYDSRGQLVRTLRDQVLPVGRHDVTWDGRNGHGRTVPSGVYFVRLTTQHFTETRKAILLR